VKVTAKFDDFSSCHFRIGFNGQRQIAEIELCDFLAGLLPVLETTCLVGWTSDSSAKCRN